MSDIVKFNNAGLPTANLGQFQRKAQEALQEARDQVSVSGATFLRLNKNDGIWEYGQEDTAVEDGSLWAVNPMSLQLGVIAWPPEKSPLKQPIKKMRYIFDDTAPKIDKRTLPEPANGGAWDDCVAFQLQCIGGTDPKVTIEDVGVTLDYQQNSWGGKKAFDDLCVQLMKQIGQDPLHCVPVIELKSSTYTHEKWGKQYNPVFDVVRWVAMDGSDGTEHIIENHAAEAAAEAANEEAEAEAAATRRVRGAGQQAAVGTAPAEPPQQRRARGAQAQEPSQTEPVQRRRRR